MDIWFCRRGGEQKGLLTATTMVSFHNTQETRQEPVLACGGSRANLRSRHEWDVRIEKQSWSMSGERQLTAVEGLQRLHSFLFQLILPVLFLACISKSFSIFSPTYLNSKTRKGGWHFLNYYLVFQLCS